MGELRLGLSPKGRDVRVTHSEAARFNDILAEFGLRDDLGSAIDQKRCNVFVLLEDFFAAKFNRQREEMEAAWVDNLPMAFASHQEDECAKPT